MGKKRAGRPYRKSIEYFEFDLNLLQDPKLRRPRQKYGSLAQIVYIALLCLLYRDKGYYIPYSGEQRDDVLWQLNNMLYGGKYALKTETLSDVIDELVACELFSGDQYSRGIITSKRAQVQYYKATATRKSVCVDFSIWLLSGNEMENLSLRSPILKNYISGEENGISHAGNPVSDTLNSQSRVEKRRAEKSRAEDSRQRADVLADEAEKLIGAKLKIDENFRRDIARLIDCGMQDDAFRHAIEQVALRKSISNPAGYLRSILPKYEAGTGAKSNGGCSESDASEKTSRGYRNPFSASALEQWENDQNERIRNYLKGRKEEPT